MNPYQNAFREAFDANWSDYFRWLAAQRIEARSDETAQPVQPEGREPGPKDAPNPKVSQSGGSRMDSLREKVS